MSSEVAVAYVTLLPSFRGGARAIEKELDKPARRAGRNVGEALADEATAALGKRLGSGLGKSIARVAAQTPALARAARPLTDFAAGFRSSEAAASAFTGRLGTLGGALKRASLPLTDFIAGFRSSEAAGSAFTGRLGTLGGAAAKATAPIRILGTGIAQTGSLARGALPHLASLGQSLGTGVANGAQRAGSALATLTKVGLASAAVALLAVSGYGLSAASNLQQANVAFETLLGSQGAALQFTQQLRQFAKTTPFELPGLTRASQQLLGFGFAADKVLPILTAAGDAAAGLGRGQAGIDSFVRALGQIQAKGRVQGDELLQLSELGINGLQILADTAGTTTVEMQKLIEKGAVPATFAIDALVSGVENGTKKTKAFGGLMEKQALTLAGVFSNLKDAVTIALSDGLEPALPAIAAAITALQPSLTSFASTFGQVLGPTLTQLAKTIVPALANVFASMGPVLTSVVSKIAPLFTALEPLATTLVEALGSVVGPILDALLPAVQALVPPLQQVAVVVGQQLAAALPSIGPFVVELATSLGQVLVAVTPLLPLVADLAKELLPLLTGALGLVAKAIGYTGALITALAGFALDAARNVLVLARDGLGGLANALANVLDLIPGMGGLAQAARDAANNVTSMTNLSIANIDLVNARLQESENRLGALAQGTVIPVTIAVRTQYVNTTTLDGIMAASKNGNSFAPKIDVGGGFKPPKFTPGGGGSSGSGGGAKSKVAQARDALLESIAGTFVSDLVKSSPAEIYKSIRGLIGQVKAALSGSAESNVVKLLKVDSVKLTALAKKRDAILARIADAKALKTSVATSARADITQLPKSAPGIVRALAKRLDTIKRFRANLSALAKRGLPKAFLQQLIDAGLDGAETAAALVRSSGADFKKIKSLSFQIGTESNKLGETSARLMYGAGVSSAKGLIAGLASQAKAIENQMTKIAKAMIRAMKKALGIKSPSRQFALLAKFSAAGWIDELHRQTPAATRAAADLVAVPAASSTRPSTARLAAAFTGGPAAAYHPAGVGGPAGTTYNVDKLEVVQHAPRTYPGSTVQALRDMAHLLGATV